MIRFALYILSFCYVCVPVHLSAQTATVRAGEHDTFTRLVVDLPRRLEFEISGERSVALKIADLDGFDTSAVMPRLNKGRILGVTPSARGQLNIKLACACSVRSFYAGDKMLVIDFSGEPEEQPAVAGQDVRTQEQPKPEQEQAVKLPLILPAAPEVGTTDWDLPSVATADKPQAIESAKRQAEARLRLLEKASRGAVQGLLTPRKKLTSSEKADDRLPKADGQTEQGDEKREGRTTAPQINFKAQTSADRDFLNALSRELPNRDETQCMNASALDLHSWYGDGDFGKTIGTRRAELFGEFDRPKADAAQNLARSYLAFGFGVEALQVLENAEISHSESHFAVMADLVERGHTNRALPSSWHTDCVGSAALWAYLGGKEPTLNRPLNTSALQAAFSALPKPVRAHLGPKLIQKLQSDGYSDSATALLRLTGRGQAQEITALTMAEASLHLAEGKPPDARADLENVVEANGPEAVDALVKLVDSLLKSDQALPPRYISLAEAFLTEYRRDAKALELKRILAKAYASEGRYSEAVERLTAVAPKLEPDRRKKASDFVLQMIALRSDDLGFLELAFERALEDMPASSAVEHLMANRLLDLGFPEQALVYLSTSARGEEGRQRKLIRARAAIDMARPRQAEAELLGLHGTDVEALRVSAKILQSDHRAARIALATQGATDAAAEQAWLGEELLELNALNSDNWDVEAELSSQNSSTSEDSPPLASGNTLLKQSESLRQLVEEVLGRHQVTQAEALE